jgi:hypothetical protein
VHLTTTNPHLHSQNINFVERSHDIDDDYVDIDEEDDVVMMVW